MRIIFTIAYVEFNLIFAARNLTVQLLRRWALFLWRQEDTSSLHLFSVDSSGRQMIGNFKFVNLQFICLFPPTIYTSLYSDVLSTVLRVKILRFIYIFALQETYIYRTYVHIIAQNLSSLSNIRNNILYGQTSFLLVLIGSKF